METYKYHKTYLIRKKILVLAHDSTLYGASLSLLAILEHLSKDKSFEIMIFLPYGGIIEERLKILKINYKIISFPRCVADKTNNIRLRIKKVLKYYIKKSKILPEILYESYQFKPDLVYTNTSVVSIGHTIAKKLHVPHIWHIREFGDSNWNYEYLPFKQCIKNKIKKSDKIIFVSEALLKYWMRYKKKNFRVIYNGIKLPDFVEPLLLESFSKYKFALLGVIVPGKGQELAIRAFANVLSKTTLDCELHFYGDILDKDYFNKLRYLTNYNKLNTEIVFHPFVADNELIYKEVNIVLNCSASEGFGRTIIEAMGRGIPVISNANGGPLEIINDGIDGLLYYDNSPECLSEVMIKLLSDNNLYNNISRNARDRAINRFSEEKYISSLLEVINEALQV